MSFLFSLFLVTKRIVHVRGDFFILLFNYKLNQDGGVTIQRQLKFKVIYQFSVIREDIL